HFDPVPTRVRGPSPWTGLGTASLGCAQWAMSADRVLGPVSGPGPAGKGQCAAFHLASSADRVPGHVRRPCPWTWLEQLVPVDLDQPLVADPEMVCDLVQHDSPHLAAERLRVGPVEALERPAVDGD